VEVQSWEEERDISDQEARERITQRFAEKKRGEGR